MKINPIVKDKNVIMIKGDFRKLTGTFKGITGYTDGYGTVCKINIDDIDYEYTSDFFMFVDDIIQEKWDSDEYDFEIDV